MNDDLYLLTDHDLSGAHPALGIMDAETIQSTRQGVPLKLEYLSGKMFRADDPAQRIG